MDEKLRFATEKWSLFSLAEIYRRHDKAVCSAESEIYGAVILKIADDLALLRSEHTALVRFTAASAAADLSAPNAAGSASAVCAVRAYDGQNGLLLLERIEPGAVLRDEPSLEKRLAAFKSVFDRIHTPQTEGESYLDWLAAAADFSARKIDDALAERVRRAHTICADLFEKYTDRVLLHGDLHHDNLLCRADGTYAVIDPKGVVGPAILDLPRFIMNEIDTAQTEGFYAPPQVDAGSLRDSSDALIDPTCRAHMTAVVRRISELFGYPLADVARAYYMEVILGNVWCVQDGEPADTHEIAIAESILNEVAQ